MKTNKKKIKIVSIVGTRPEIIRLSRIFSILDIYCEHILIHTGQNYDYELNQIFFNDLKIRKPDFFLNSGNKSKSVCETIGTIISETDKILEKIKPDALLVLGDTNSCLSVIPAKKQKIPIFHMEAGNRCFDQRVPEEINRRIVDHVADINLTYSSIAREYLLKEGLPSDQIIKIGSPMYEVINYYLPKIKKSNIISKLKLKKKNYFLISAHREENIENDINFDKLFKMINFLAKEYNVPVIVSTHPRTQKKLNFYNKKFSNKVNLLKPLGFYDYVNLQMNAKSTLSDSGTITEESSILNFPALNIRETHERPEGMEESSVMMVGLETDRIQQGLMILEKQSKANKRTLSLVKDYDVPNVSEKIVRIIHSYIDYINRKVWKK
ncbi:UDP-N-acetylglucosamine 2-epimerase (non-hydrolyzing) [Candidatus Pelagibacter sp.]|nr:UDP-N-acetylglucosamine 2-epimerase (non-hydrolyzing) [Candidatus Pelagibacter sp.]